MGPRWGRERLLWLGSEGTTSLHVGHRQQWNMCPGDYSRGTAFTAFLLFL